MRILLIFLIFIFNLSAEQIVNGDIYILKMKSNQAGNLKVNGKKFKWYDANNGNKIALISANFRNKNDIVITNTLNGKTESLTLKAVLGDYKKEKISVNKNKVNPPKEVQDRISKEYEEAVKIYAIHTSKFLFDSSISFIFFS